MTWDRRLYPSNWEQIARDVKQQANWHCEECGRPCRKPGEEITSHYERLKEANQIDWLREYWSQWVDNGVPYKPTRFVLTVAHLDHNPANCDRSNLKALCSVCHLQLDNTPSARFQKQQVKAERMGQLRLLNEPNTYWEDTGEDMSPEERQGWGLPKTYETGGAA